MMPALIVSLALITILSMFLRHIMRDAGMSANQIWLTEWAIVAVFMFMGWFIYNGEYDVVMGSQVVLWMKTNPHWLIYGLMAAGGVSAIVLLLGKVKARFFPTKTVAVYVEPQHIERLPYNHGLDRCDFIDL